MATPLSAPATEVQNNFGTFLSKVAQTDQPVFVERHGKPVAVLVSLNAWQEKAGQKTTRPSAWLQSMVNVSEKIRKKYPPQTPAVELVRQLRDEA